MTTIALSVLILAAILGLFVIIVKVARPGALLKQILLSYAPQPNSTVTDSTIDVAPPYTLSQSMHGWMLVNPNDFYLGRAILEYGECCELESQLLLSIISIRPGEVVEVGSNIGVHTVSLARFLASQQRELVAFEPQPFIFQNLCANLALNGINNVRAWPWACGAKTETVYFHLPNYASPGNFGGISMSENRVAHEVPVPCVRLDDIIGDDPVSLLKIDVEGFELFVLQGAINTLTKSRPILYVENDRPEKSQALIEWLWENNYQLWWHIPLLFNPDNFFKNETNIYDAIGSFNMVCMPRELNIPVEGLPEILSSTDHPLISRP